MGLLEIKNMNLSFADKVIFKNANFFVNKGDKMGIVGVNGAGKSTLLKILSKDFYFDSGTYTINPNIKIGYLDQHALIDSEKDIMNYLRESYGAIYDADAKLASTYEKMAYATSEQEFLKLTEQTEKLMEFLENNDFYSLDGRIEKVADGLGITSFGLDAKVKTLSSGQRAKVRLAKLLLEKPDVLLLDEPTNFLDIQHIDWLSNFLANFDGTFVVVSHDEEFLKRVTNCIADIDTLTITRYNESFAKYLQTKQMRVEQYENAYKKQQKTIEKLEDYIARNLARASTTRMAQSRRKQLEKMELIEKPSEHKKPTFLFNYKKLGSEILLEVKDLFFGYDKPLLKSPVNLVLKRGEKLAITGFNGIGKSTFLKTISGLLPAISGNFKYATNVVVGSFEQELIFPDLNQTPLDYIWDEYPKFSQGEIRSFLAKCGLTSKHIAEKIKNLSGGEQTKIKICKLMLYPCNILILDEPTNHIDKNCIEQLSVAIKNFGGTILFVSHDANFVKQNADKILSFEELLK